MKCLFLGIDSRRKNCNVHKELCVFSCSNGVYINIVNEQDNLFHIHFYPVYVQCISLCYIMYSNMDKERRYFVPFKTDVLIRYCNILSFHMSRRQLSMKVLLK
jgi:hypothetical protein